MNNKELVLDYINRYSSSGLLIDSNLLLLLFIGDYDPKMIETFKRTQKYILQDYAFLKYFMGKFKIIFTTPNILTEVSNLSNQLNSNTRLDYYEIFAKNVKLLNEVYHNSTDICENNLFKKLGLTDAVISFIANNGCLVITDDFTLANCLEKKQLAVFNYNNIRTDLLY